MWSVKNHTTTSNLALLLELKASFKSSNFIVLKGNSALDTQDPFIVFQNLTVLNSIDISMH